MAIDIRSRESRERERSSDLLFGAFIGLLLGIAGNLWVVLFDRLIISHYSHSELISVFLMTSGVGILLIYLLHHLSRESDFPLSFQDSKEILYPENSEDLELRDNKSSSFTELNDKLISERTVKETDDSSDDIQNNCSRNVKK
ncbi:unnamed protein product [marine sediment metagenome]|uniref:Uncharacterized protein n=1 Tax=marine sediment metagenome TaxID=412755 RepID=X1HAH5_9ZZZZ